MNHSYRVIWNVVTSTWQAVAETAKGRGKSKSVAQGVAAATLLLAGATVAAGPLPTGGNIVAGSGAISQSGSTMTINQSTAKMAVNWDSFSVGQGNTVNFVQPSASAVALNRVLGSDVSVIQGAINANGQVFLLNPNGVLFTPTAQVNVGALMASTLKMSTDDFMAGNYKLSGDSSNAVINQGNITAVGDAGKGGAIALIAAKVINEGNLTANSGNVLLGAGSEVLLDLGGPVKLQVTQGAIDALVQNSGAIQADGGLIYLTAQAVNTLTTATINNTGVIRAQTLATGEKGEIRLMADMAVGTVNVGGTLDASAPKGGDGGFIETSGATVKADASLRVDTSATDGKAGLWLIDPVNITIGAAGSNILASTVSTALNSGNVTISTSGGTGGIGTYTSGPTGSQTTTDQAGTSGAGDITVSSAISKTAGGDSTLTLLADRNITVNAPITSTSGALNLTLSAANNTSTGTLGGVLITSNIQSNGGNILIGGGGGNNSTAQAPKNGIGYARNYSASMAAVTIDPLTANSVSVKSNGGNITINGYSTTNPSGNGDGSGVHVKAGSVIDSGYYIGTSATSSAGGNINISGYAVGANNQFGIQFDQNTGQSLYKTTVATSPVNGTIVLDGNNPLNSQYALGLSNPGNQGNLYFAAYSTADLLVLINGNASIANFQTTPPNSGCRVGFPNCGTFSVPGANGSYPDATFNAVVWSANNLYITGSVSGTKVYDGLTAATGLTGTGLSCSGILASCTQTTLNNAGLWSFTTASPNVGNYSVITPTTRTYTSGGTTYRLGYFFLSGTYNITPKPLGITVTGNYNGTTNFSTGAATITTTGLASTDTLTGVTINSPNVTGAFGNGFNYVTGLSGTTTNGTGQFRSSNYSLASVNYTVADSGSGSSSFGPSLTQTQSPTTSTNAVWLNTAQLVGLTVSGVYNGTTTYSTSNTGTTITVSGLVQGEEITSVRVNSADVAANGSNFVTAILGGTGPNFAASNYTFNGAANYRLSDGSDFNGTLPANVTPVVGTGVTEAAKLASSTNAVILSRAPLNVSVTGVYSGSTTITPTNASTYSGWVGADDLNKPVVTSATLNDRNVGATNKYVTSISSDLGLLASLLDGTNVTLTSPNGGNYYLNNGYNPAAPNNGANPQNIASLTPAALTVTADPQTKVYGNSDPALTYRSSGLFDGDALTGVLARVPGETVEGGPYTINQGTLGNSNYAITFIDGALTITPRPSAVLQPPPPPPIIVPAFPDNGIKAIANDTRPPEFGGMNYVAALFEGATPTTTSPTATGQTQGTAPTASAAPTQTGAMNYVSISSKVTDAGQELQVRLPEDKNRKPQSELNVNNTTVSSNTSPLDVFVVDTGINLSNLNNGK